MKYSIDKMLLRSITIKFFCYLIVLMASSCQKKNDYAKIIEQRANTNLDLSYKDIHIGDSFAKYSTDNHIIANVASEKFTLPIVSLPDNQGGIGGDVTANVSIEQHNQSNKVDAIVVSIEGYGYVQESLVNEYIKKYDMYSYCLISYGYPGSATYREEKLVPDTNTVFTPESILRKSLQAKENMNDTKATIRYVWEWKNSEISILSSYAFTNVIITLSKK